MVSTPSALARSDTRLLVKRSTQAVFQCNQDGVARSSRSCTAAGAAREPVRAAAAAERRVHLQTGRCCRARFVGVDAAARSGRIGGAAQLLLFEVANIRIWSPSMRTAGGGAIPTCCCAQFRHRQRQRALPPPTLQLPGRLSATTIQRASRSTLRIEHVPARAAHPRGRRRIMTRLRARLADHEYVCARRR